MKSASRPKPPARLSREAKRWWQALVGDYEFDEPGLLLLESALESFDRMRQAQAVIAAEGIVVKDRFGQPKQHPATIVERDAKMAMVRQLKALNLDLEPLHDRPGRPSGR
jgi:P27 family predicted phage terminase small subunit